MKSIPLAGLMLLVVACAAGLSGCATVRRSRSASAEEASLRREQLPNPSSDVPDKPAGGSPAPEDVVRLPPVDTSPVQQASAEIPFYYGKSSTNSFENLPVPNQSDVGHTPFFGGERSLHVEGAPTADQAEIWRLPSVDADETVADEKPFTFGDLFKEQGTGILEDYSQFYSLKSLSWLAAGFGAGALMANTDFDEKFARDAIVENVIMAPTDEYTEQLGRAKIFGEGQYFIPIYAIAALAEPLIDDLPLGEATAEWGQRSFRTLLVGVPPLLTLQLLTGGSRPGESSSTSHWKPLQDDNGVSGHGFMGAVPFLSAAKMTDNIWLKSGLYVASTLPALSRLSDDDHYFSQAFLGWWLAYLAASAVDRSHDPDSHHRFVVYPEGDGVIAGLEYNH